MAAKGYEKDRFDLDDDTPYYPKAFEITAFNPKREITKVQLDKWIYVLSGQRAHEGKTYIVRVKTLKELFEFLTPTFDSDEKTIFYLPLLRPQDEVSFSGATNQPVSAISDYSGSVARVMNAIFTLSGNLYEKCNGSTNLNVFTCYYRKEVRSAPLISGSTSPFSGGAYPSIPVCEDVVKDVGVGVVTRFSVADAHCVLPEGESSSPVRLKVVKKRAGLDVGVDRVNPYAGEVGYEAKKGGEGLYDEMVAYVMTSDGFSSLPFTLFARHRYAPDCGVAGEREVIRSTEVVFDRKQVCPDKDVDVPAFADLSKDAMRVEVVDPPAHGGVWVDGSGDVHYRSFVDFVGGDSVKIKATDRFGLSSEVEIPLRVIDVRPSCTNVGAYTARDMPVMVQLDCQVFPPEPMVFLKPLEFRVEPTDQPEHGTLGVIDQFARTVQYSPDPGFTGRDTFTYTADNNGVTRTAQATININP